MDTSSLRGYGRLAAVTALFIYLLIVVGGIVRVSGSGLGCPDWPTCYGSLLPPSASNIQAHPQGDKLIDEMGGLEPAITAARVEYTHRIVASVGGIFILLTVVLAWLQFRRHRWIVVPASIIIGLMFIQVPLGGLVVITELEPVLVAIHLGIALLIFAASLMIAVYALRDKAHTVSHADLQGHRFLLTGTAIALFIVLLFGAVVVGSNTGLSCPNWPLCNQSAGVILVPPAGFSPRIWFHLLHRYTIAAFSILLLYTFAKIWRSSTHIKSVAAWNYAMGAAFIIQVLIGAFQVWLSKPPVLRILHLAVASIVWASLIVIGSRSYLFEKTEPHIANR